MDRTLLLGRIKEASYVTIDMVNEWVMETPENTIPHIIHFCFCDFNNIPENYLKYMETWFEKMPDWHYVNWTPNNIKFAEINTNGWVDMLYNKHKFAFVSDYVRVWAVSNFGGFYLDCDVVVHKSLNPLTDLPYIFDRETWTLDDINPWGTIRIDTGVFGSIKNNRLITAVLNWYNSIKTDFVKLMYEKDDFALFRELKSHFISVHVWYYVGCLNQISFNYDYEGLVLYRQKLNNQFDALNSSIYYVLNSTYLSMGDTNHIHDFEMRHLPWSYASHMFNEDWELDKK